MYKQMWKFLAIMGMGFSLTSLSPLQAAAKSRFEQLELFNKVLYLIESQYYRDVDSGKLIEGALKGMMETLDPHSGFLAKDIFDKMQVDTSGEFGGLGIEVSQKDGILYVITAIDDTPAYKAGLRSGDKIMEIDHEPTAGMTLDQAVNKMRGKPNSKIEVGVLREGLEGMKTYSIAREVIKVRPVKAELVDENFAFVRLTQFQKNSGEAIREAIKKLRAESTAKGGLKGIVLDLRSNPGGLLDEAVEVASLFLPYGPDKVVVSTEGRDPKNKEIRYVTKNGDKEIELPMAVLINGASASASEIVAGALQDHHRAVLMGSQSFGKGSVQTVAKIDEDNGLKLTIAQYMTPSGKKIQAIGIKPDVDLDEVDSSWTDKFKKLPRYLREADLKNHLVATIESSEEKAERERREKEERKQRAQEMERYRAEAKKKKDKVADAEEEDLFKKYEAKNDYQVHMAINLLKSYKVFKNYEQVPLKSALNK